MSNIRFRYIVTIVVLALAIGAATYYPVKNYNSVTENETPKEAVSFSLAIDDVATTTNLTSPQGTSALKALEDFSATHPETTLGVKVYEGLGTLVETIGSHTNGEDGKYWQYYVNDKQPMVGANAYIIQNGDAILWTFAKSEM